MLINSHFSFKQSALAAVLLLFLFTGTSIIQAQHLKRPPSFEKWNLPLLPSYSDYPIDSVVRFDFTVTMRDGVIMDCIKFIPNGPAPAGGWPTVMMVHGYGDNKETLAGFCKAQALYGYYTMSYSVRGQGNSGGLSNLISKIEMLDLLEIINYVKADTLSGSNPDKILIMGGSQGGVLPFRAACNGAPVKTVITSVAPPNFASSWIENGCVKMTLLWTIEYTPDTARYTPVVDRMSDWIYADSKKYWDSLAYWLPVDRDFMNEIPNCSVPMLVEASWQDKFFNADGVMQGLNLLSVPFSSYIGAVQGHGGDHSPTEDLWHMNWFNDWFFQWLFDINTGILDAPKFQYASSTFPVLNNYWSFVHDSSSIPLPSITTNLRLYFNRRDKLTTTPNNVSTHYVNLFNNVSRNLTMEEAVNEEFSGPAFDSKFSKHSLTFETAPLAAATVMTGTPKVSAQYQSNSMPFLQLNYQIHEVLPTGETRFVTRVNFMDRSNVWNQKRTRIFKGQSHSHIFQAGSKIRVVLTNFDWDRTDSVFLGTNPFVLPCLNFGTHKVFLYNQSYIDLPIELPAGLIAQHLLLDEDGSSTNKPYEYSLMQNYPNPFNPATTINYTLAESGIVELKIYDILGREVITLVNDFRSAGNHSVYFNAVNLSSGIYFCRINSSSFRDVKKMVLVK